MKRLVLVIATSFIVFAAGFGMGLYTMHLKTETQIYAWIENSQNWQYEAERNSMAAEYYRKNAELNIYTAEILKEICDNRTAENAELNQQIDLLEYELRKVLNPDWEVNY